MSRRMEISDLRPVDQEQVNRAIGWHLWVPVFLATFLVIISVSLGKVYPNHHWTQRVGSLVTILGVYIGFVDARVTGWFTPINQSYGSVDLPFKYGAVGLAFVGTLIWGYADLVL
jgi:hypothetical protein